LFDGTGDYLSVPDHADWTLGTAEFTFDEWLNSPLNSDECIISQETDNGNYWEWELESTGALHFHYIAGSSSEETVLIETASGVVSANTDTHVALSRDSSGTYYVFVNGELKYTETDTDSIADLTGDLLIGYVDYGTAEPFEGWMDEVRVSNGVARWTSNFEPPISEYAGTGKAYIRIGSPRPLQGFKLYMGTSNTATSTMAVYYWNGSAWTSVTNLSDGTSSGGVSLAQTGSVTFDSTVSNAKPKIESLTQLYWYKILVSACDTTTTITYSTLDAPVQDMVDIWDGSYRVAPSAFIDKSTGYQDVSVEFYSTDLDLFAILDSLAAGTESLLLGFTERQQGVYLKLLSTKENSGATVLTVSYWDGSAWTEAGNINDGTSENGVSLNKSGVITWEPANYTSEFKKEIEQQAPLYWYKLTWSNGLDAEVEMYNATGIPATEEIKPYSFAAMFQERTFLFDEANEAKNKARYSAYNSPYVFNGDDSGSLYFGDESKITAAANIYNVYQTTGLAQLIVFKENETWRLFGDGPENWEIQQMSGNVGCVAPLSIAVADLSAISEDVKRHVVIWQGSAGIYMSDGATIQRISNDINNYWDANSDDYIPTDRMDDSVGFYDVNLQSYKLLISSGSGQTTHNVELEYSLRYNEWTKIYREDSNGADPLQIGFPVFDTGGNAYTYGATNDGYVFRLENGNSWAGTPIAQYFWTKDVILDDQKPFFNHTIIEYLRMLYENKDSGTISASISHYCDGTLTTDGTNNQDVPAAIDMTSGNRSTQDCVLGPCLKHSFKISTSTDDVTDGMEALGLGFWYQSLDKVME